MNGELVRWLLGIERIPASAEGVRMAFERGMPGWLWLVLLLAAVGFAIWTYRAIDAPRLARGLLAVGRAAVIALLLLLLSGPVAELPRETIEEDWVLVLLDRSASLEVADVDDPFGAGRITRDEQLRSILEDHADLWQTLDEDRELVWLGFHGGAFPLAGETAERARAADVAPGDPDGRRTRLGQALEQALRRAAARPLAGVVVLTDGRTDDAPDRPVLRRLQSGRVPVFPVPLGSPDPLGDLALRRVEAPRRAFVGDKVPISVELEAFGSVRPGEMVTVRLVDTLGDTVLDETIVEWSEDLDLVTLVSSPELAGEALWRIEVETERADLVPENNLREVGIELVDRPLRVLFIEGYPRWEYRYLKNLMVRERSIESSVMLISADRDFAQEGNQPITRLPRSPEEFAAFDVIVLGDVPAGFFSPDQLEMIKDHVARRGAGLLWIAGERSVPRTYAGTALGDLLPMRGGLDLAAIGQPVTMQPTPLADRLGVLRLATLEGVGWPTALADPGYGWSRLRWALRIDDERLKPTAEVLAQTVQPIDGDRVPLVVSMRFGAGQSIFVGTDETWRWRYGRGESLTEQFWVQIIRMLGRESLDLGDQSIDLRASPRRLLVGQPIRIEARLLDTGLLERPPAALRAVVESADEGTLIAEPLLRPLEADADVYAATLMTDEPGELRVRLVAGQLPADLPEPGPVTVEVERPDDERRRPEADHALLAELAEATGGRVLDPGDLSPLADPEVLERRAVRTLNPLRETIWDGPLSLILIGLLLTLEWVGRRLVRLN